jgi:hypothetical protein
MSIKIITIVWELELPDSEKLALLALADAANDEGICWPSMETLARKCSKSDRTLQRAIKSLSDKGHLSRDERPGHGILYRIHPRHGVTPDTVSPVTGTTPTPDTVSPKPLLNQIPPKAPQAQNASAANDEGDAYWRLPIERKAAEAAVKARRTRRGKRRPAELQATAPPVSREPEPITPVAAKAREDARSQTMHAALKAIIGEKAWRDWFAGAAMLHTEPGVSVIVSEAMPPFRRQSLEDRFSPALLGAARRAFGGEVRWVRLKVEAHGALAV